MADFDGSKTIEEMQFDTIPIWVRVTKMPLGLMNKEYGEAIGDLVGKFMKIDAADGDSAVEEFLRIKVLLDIKKPLMHGVTLTVEREGGEKDVWCPFMYEFLSDFCYICGMIGHVDRMCEVRLGQGEPKPYNSRLRFIPEKKKFMEESYGRQGFKSGWRARGSGTKNSWGSGGRSRSDGLSWRKSVSGGGGKSGGETGEEVTSPLKCLKAPHSSEGDRGTPVAKKVLSYETVEGDSGKMEEGGMLGLKPAMNDEDTGKDVTVPPPGVLVGEATASSPLDAVDQTVKAAEEEQKKKQRTVRRTPSKKTEKREEGHGRASVEGKGGEKKRSFMEDDSMDVDEPKKQRVRYEKEGVVQATNTKAGSADRSCGDQ